MSYCTNAAVAAKNAVIIPKIAINDDEFGNETNRFELRITKKIPAVTIVAALISADTGVGPSIASGSQVCKPNCADFPTAASNKHKPIHSKLSVAMLSASEYSITGNTTLKSN